MARNFRRHRGAHAIAELNVTNLIDLAFMLLIIFMVATPLIQMEQTIPVNLPTVAKAPQKQAEKSDRFVAVAVDTAGRLQLENGGPVITLTDLRRRFEGFAAETKQPVIRIRGDGDAAWKWVAQVFNEAEKAGLTRVTIDYQTKD